MVYMARNRLYTFLWAIFVLIYLDKYMLWCCHKYSNNYWCQSIMFASIGLWYSWRVLVLKQFIKLPNPSKEICEAHRFLLLHLGKTIQLKEFKLLGEKTNLDIREVTSIPLEARTTLPCSNLNIKKNLTARIWLRAHNINKNLALA